VKHGDVSASIPRGQDPATVNLEQAVELIAARAGARRGARRTAKRGKAKAPAARPKTMVAEPKPATPAERTGEARTKKPKRAAARARKART
jgi:DNA topoisomerase-1